MPMSPETAFTWLKNTADRFEASKFCSPIFDNPKFPVWSGSGKPHQHHYGTGGLVVHTQEVVDLCLTNNTNMEYEIDERKLFLAALFHDVGKMWDYEKVPEDDKIHDQGPQDAWRGTDHKRHIHHISRSVLVWQQCRFQHPQPWLKEEFSDDVIHAILAHHGLRAWGSPVLPNTKLAWLLHLCDGISARMYDAEIWDQTKIANTE